MSIHIEQGKFDSTRWTLVKQAASDGVKVSDKAISEIFKRYWTPLYVFARCKGLNSSDAEDVIQLFFSELLEKKLMKKVDQQKGKLRTFFLTVVERIILQKQRGEMAQKRGGGIVTFSMDQAKEEEWFMSEPSDGCSPESLYDKRWALSILEQSLVSLRRGYEKKGKADLFDALKSHLGWSEGEQSYAQIGKEHEMSEGAIKVAVYRLRKQYKECLQSQIADTIGTNDQSQIKEEIEHLFAALA